MLNGSYQTARRVLTAEQGNKVIKEIMECLHNNGLSIQEANFLLDEVKSEFGNIKI